jgi:hypothetical protein
MTTNNERLNEPSLRRATNDRLYYWYKYMYCTSTTYLVLVVLEHRVQCTVVRIVQPSSFQYRTLLAQGTVGGTWSKARVPVLCNGTGTSFSTCTVYDSVQVPGLR